MMANKTEIIVGCAVLAVVIVVVGGGLWWRHHENRPKQLSETSSQSSGGADTPLGQDDSGGLSVNGQASDLGQLSGGNNSQAQGTQNSGNSGGSGGIDPASFAQYDKYKTAKSALFGDIQKGSGAQASAGSKVGIYYKVWLTNGALVDQSPVSSSGQPQAFSFTVGAHQVIPGMEQGVYGMKVGGQRLIIVPPVIGYGSKGQGSVPPNSVLVFEVQLASVN